MVNQHIAIVAFGAMADCLYATPIVRHIRMLHPEAHISWLIRDKFLEVVETNPDIDEVVPFVLPEGYASRQEAEHVMDREMLADAKANYDQVYDLQYWPRYSNFYERPAEDFISLRARNAGLDPAKIIDRKIILNLTNKDLDNIKRFYLEHLDGTKGFITVNHISYSASPVWSFDNYAKLVGLLRAKHIDAVFTGAPNEPIPEGTIDARGMPYREWAALIGISDLFLGLDSGAKALAASTKTPMIILQSKDFQLQKTGCVAMGIRTEKIKELITIPTVDCLADMILSEIPLA